MSRLAIHLDKMADHWCMKNRTLRGKPYRFSGKASRENRQFLRHLLRDSSKRKTYRKSRQCGVSETSVSELLFNCHNHPYKKFMYLFPTKQQIIDFVQTRIDPVLHDSPRIMQHVTRNNVHSKHVFTSDILFRSGSKAGQGEGADIDGLYIDERDRMDPKQLDAFEEGLSSSDLKLVRDISTPSLPATGVDKSFRISDQKEWFLKCTACGKRQTLDFPESIVFVKKEGKHDFICKHCRSVGTIDRTDGEWVPKIKDVQTLFSGYQISQLICPWISADEIIYKRDKMALPQFFFNYVLGLPYAGSNLLIIQPTINNCVGNIEELSRGKMIMGVDWGDTSWVVVGTIYNERLLIVHYEKIASPDPEQHIVRVAEMIKTFGIDLCVCDSGYGKDRNAALYKVFPGTVFACNYVDTENSTLIENEWSANKGKNGRITNARVRANRTVSLKVMARGWKQKDIILPAKILMTNDITEDFFNHLKSLASKWEDLGDGKAVERIGATGPDHLGHAMNYMYMAFYKVTNRSYASIGYVENTSQQLTSIFKQDGTRRKNERAS